MQTDLKSVRELAEDAGKKAADGIQLKKDLEALSAGVAEKHAAIETIVKEMVAEAKKAAVDRVDEVEKKLNRMRLRAGHGDDELKLARRSEERSGGKECVRRCRSRWSP